MSVSGKSGGKKTTCLYIRHGPLIVYSNILLLCTQKMFGYCTKEVPSSLLCCTTNGTWNTCSVYLCEYSLICIKLNLPLSCRGSPCLSFPGIRQQQLHHRSKHRSSRCEPHAQYTHAHPPPMSQAGLFAHCMYVLYDTRYTCMQHLSTVCVLSYVWIYLYVFCQATCAATLAYLSYIQYCNRVCVCQWSHIMPTTVMWKLL